MRHMALRCGAAAAAAVTAACAGPLAVGDICYRFCEDDSEEFVNRRSDCPADAPCAARSDADMMVSFDSCGGLAEICGGGVGKEPKKGGEDDEVHVGFGYGKEPKESGLDDEGAGAFAMSEKESEGDEVPTFGKTVSAGTKPEKESERDEVHIFGQEQKKSSDSAMYGSGKTPVDDEAQKRRLRQGRQPSGGAPRALSDDVVDCTAEPERAECCILEDSGCMFKSIDAANDGCSIACERMYVRLPYSCYENYRMHSRFSQIMKNCDPTNSWKWRAPTTTRPMRAFNINEQRQPSVASQATTRVARSTLPMAVAAAAALGLICLA